MIERAASREREPRREKGGTIFELFKFNVEEIAKRQTLKSFILGERRPKSFYIVG